MVNFGEERLFKVFGTIKKAPSPELKYSTNKGDDYKRKLNTRL
jgi:hypothetical protein